jgi:hypothetical protein
MSNNAWYAASLPELKALLDRIGDEGEVTLRPGDDAVAAIIAQLQASQIVYATAQAVHHTRATLALLEVS